MERPGCHVGGRRLCKHVTARACCFPGINGKQLTIITFIFTINIFIALVTFII
jgi:hypothetical protein